MESEKIKTQFFHFESDNNIENIDIICTEKIQYSDKVVACSLLKIDYKQDTETHTLNIKFEWIDSLYRIDREDLYFIMETHIVFFRSIYQWGAIDLKNKVLLRYEDALCYPNITRKNNHILIIDELYAESTTLNAQRIDNVPIDPPYDIEEFDDRIEFTSPVFGHQILKLK